MSFRTEDRSGRPWLGVGVGMLAFLVGMLGLAGLAITLGWIKPTPEGTPDLTPWLRLEIIGGAGVSLVAGRWCRRVARDPRAPRYLAIVIGLLGWLEAVELFQAVGGESSPSNLAMIFIAPLVGVGGILLGGGGVQPHRGWTALLAKGAHLVRTTSTAGRLVAILALPLLACVIAIVVVPTLDAPPKAHVVASALTVDLTIAWPALIYAMLIRGKRHRWWLIVPSIIAGYTLATLVTAAEHRELLNLLRYLAIPFELGVLGYLAIRARQSLRETRFDGDWVSKFRSLATDTLGHRLAADILTTEFSVLRFALGPRQPAAGPAEFSVHRRVSYLGAMLGIVAILAMETFVLHGLISPHRPRLAWCLTALSLYALLWLIGDYRALVQRRTYLGAGRLHLRQGIRWEAQVPLVCITESKLIVGTDREKAGALSIELLGQANVRLSFREPVEFIGMYGIRKRAQQVCLQLDEPEAFLRSLKANQQTAVSPSDSRKSRP